MESVAGFTPATPQEDLAMLYTPRAKYPKPFPWNVLSQVLYCVGLFGCIVTLSVILLAV